METLWIEEHQRVSTTRARRVDRSKSPRSRDQGHGSLPSLKQNGVSSRHKLIGPRNPNGPTADRQMLTLLLVQAIY